MTKTICTIFAIFIILTGQSAKADLFGGDVVVLGKILMETVKQLAAMEKIVNSGKTQLALFQNINRGINDSLNLIDTSSHLLDPGLYRELKNAKEVLSMLDQLYGKRVSSSHSQIQNNTDITVAEAINLNNQIYEYSKKVDQIGEEIKSYSHHVSPGGAQKLTAQSLGVMINVLNQMLRAQSSGLKLQAQALALQNNKDKEYSKHIQSTSTEMSNAMSGLDPSFEIPRF